MVEFVAETRLPTVRGTYRVRAYREYLTPRPEGGRPPGGSPLEVGSEPLAIVYGEPEGEEGVLVRVHDECLTSEVLGSLKCDCRDQLDQALEAIRDEGAGVVIYLRQEGRGIGLANKIAAYALQEEGLDTVDANRALGLPDDARLYETAARILADLRLDDIRLMTNNPRKIERLEGLGVGIRERVPSLVGANRHSQSYLDAKFERMGHLALPAALASK